MNAQEIKKILKSSFSFNTSNIFIPEYTHGDLRADAIIVNTKKRLIRGFEIKVSRADFIQDDKWILYSQFCSSLSIVCPENLIQPSEIEKPFGLLWILENEHLTNDFKAKKLAWKKKPQNFQKRNSLSWLWTYTHVIELEIMRLDRELSYRQMREAL
jgi:hypothetical protein